jgi:hypothetical protein
LFISFLFELPLLGSFDFGSRAIAQHVFLPGALFCARIWKSVLRESDAAIASGADCYGWIP